MRTAYLLRVEGWLLNRPGRVRFVAGAEIVDKEWARMAPILNRWRTALTPRRAVQVWRALGWKVTWCPYLVD